MIINASICLSDIPKDKITTASNGKKYLNISIADKREPVQYGKDTTIYLNQTKEEREAQAAKVYIGNGKKVEFTNAIQPSMPSTPAPTAPPPQQNFDDLPF